MSISAPPAIAVMPNQSSGISSPPVNGSVVVPVTATVVGVVLPSTVEPWVPNDVLVVEVGKIVVEVLPSTAIDVVVVGSVVVEASVVEVLPCSSIEVVVVG
jgi:hypothetical protein